MIVTRFAPSPTGRMHLGHAASALFAYEIAQKEGGRFLLRIEDIDPTRCRDEYVDEIYEDLDWLGLTWEEPVRRQSQHMNDYGAALDKLKTKGLLYPCFCTRSEIMREAEAAGYAPHSNAEGPMYAGMCRALTQTERDEKSQKLPSVWRLDMQKALDFVGPLSWHDRGRGKIEANPARFGDVVLARKDICASYHLCVTLDDALQGVTLVTRGEDLLGSTDIHVLLQKLLDLPQPDYYHHPLLYDKDGKRFAKRDQSITLRAMRQSGVTAHEVRVLSDNIHTCPAT